MSAKLFNILQSSASPSRLNLDDLRAKLAGAKGPQFWRSLDELARTPEFQRYVEDEFPYRADDLKDPATRRDILRFVGAAFALAGLTGCTKQPQEKILPYVRQPEEHILGRPLFYATSMPFRGSAMGVLVESHEGRPTKIEGNPQHPESLGRTLPWQQAATLDLYDPDRSQAVIVNGRPSTWGRFLGTMAEVRRVGQGIHILSGPVNSPSLLAQRAALQQRYPSLVWHEYDPINQDNVLEGARLAFGQPVHARYQFDRADVILSLDCDFLLTLPGSIPYARGYISRRHAALEERGRMNRLYVAEATPTITGDKADHRLPLRAAEIELLARAIAAQVGVSAGAAPNLPGSAGQWASVVARELQAHRGTSLVLAGEHQPPAVHALAHAMNQALGNAGQTVSYFEPLIPNAGNQAQSLRSLVDAMNGGQVRTLLLLHANPVYDAPVDLNFAEALKKVPFRVHHGLYQDETAAHCTWHIPGTHFLESWGDARAYDGTVGIIQPLIAPLYDGKTVSELLAALTDNPDQSSYQITKSFWQAQGRGGANFEEFWEQTLHDGVMPNTAYAARTVTARTDLAALPAPAGASGGYEIVFRPDPSIWDGRWANNGWLQELPKPHTKLTWDNAALVSPATAQKLGLENENQIELTLRGRKVTAPVWITPGQPNDSIAVHLGYGREKIGRVAENAGFNAYLLRTSDALHHSGGLEVRKVGGRYPLACTQDHHSMEGRDIVRVGANQEYVKNNHLFLTEENEEKEADQVTLSLYPEWRYNGYAWGMAIDQNACIGCNACVVACVAENNIAVVGKRQVLNGREMHWLRIDRYFSGSLDNPETHFQPMLCQHCEKAPCEPVCPVAATVHSGEGLNQMIYNRCVGTRYCSNNCPYKVRRFNFLLYQDWVTPSLEGLRNPDVTVRSRGVMEKCTFCVQRLQAAKIESEKEDRRIQDGDVMTACQSACPTDAIIFGDINDRGSRVRKFKESELNYSLLAELSTQPRLTYLAKLTNHNPEMGKVS